MDKHEPLQQNIDRIQSIYNGWTLRRLYCFQTFSWVFGFGYKQYSRKSNTNSDKQSKCKFQNMFNFLILLAISLWLRIKQIILTTETCWS